MVKCVFTTSVLFSFVVTAFIIFSTPLAYCTTIYVPSDYATIQNGVDAAVAGDAIVVSAGTYPEAVTLADGLTLRGVGLPSIGSSSLANLSSANNCLIDGFRIYGLDISGKNNVTVRNCLLRGKDNVLTASSIINSQDILIEYNTFSDEYYGRISGRRVAVSGTQNLTLKNNIVLINNPDVSADITAVSLESVSGASIVTNVIMADSANRDVGIALSNMTGANAIQNNIIYDTTSSVDGDSTSVAISYNDFPEGMHRVGGNVILGYNNFSADTDFTDTTSYRIKPSSPCVDAGIVQGSEITDLGAHTDFSAILQADFIASITSGTAPLTVNFSDASSGTITNYSWDFGDGGTSVAQDPTYVYNFPGTYTVSLTVSGLGGSDTYTRLDYITVTPPDSDGDGILDSEDNYPDVWPIRIEAQYYTSLQTAYDAPLEGDTMQSQHQLLSGDFTLNRAISVSLEAGYNGDYSDPFGTTELQGTMHIIDGTLRIMAGTLRIKQ